MCALMLGAAQVGQAKDSFITKLEDVPRSTPGYLKVLIPMRVIMKLALMKLALMKIINKNIASMGCIPGLTEDLLMSFMYVRKHCK